MSSQCFSCGQNFTSDVNALLRAYKKQYEELKIVRYFYKLSINGAIMICTESSFNFIYKEHIKPNFNNGAEFSHISEYK